MIEIIPAIIAKDFQDLQEKIEQVMPFVSAVQLDVMDGIFVPNRTWNEPDDLENIKSKLFFEAHLMIDKPQTVTERWLGSRAKRIILHWEALEKIHGHEMTPYKTASRPGFPVIDLAEEAHKHNKELGIAINPETPISALDSFINDIDLVLLMSVNPGKAGQAFQEKVIPKISALRQKYPDVKIEVDGGVSPQNAKKLAQAGANILVAGSSVFESKNAEEAINQLKKAVNN
jgi:ribulose-phosphate 3-epimerase